MHLPFIPVHIDKITLHLWPMNVWYMYMSLSRMTSPCRLIRLTIISFIVSTVVVFHSKHALNNNNKVGCNEVYSFCESQTSYKYITCMHVINNSFNYFESFFIYRALRTFLICAISLPHNTTDTAC